MNVFTRISATLSATAENALKRFENHDAIAHSVLIGARRAIAQAQIRQQRMSRQLDDIRKTLADAENQEQLWTGLTAGTVLIIAGCSIRQRIAVICGALCLVIVLFSHADALISIMRGTGWPGMAHRRITDYHRRFGT